jgi:hypothetical protein
MSDDAAVLGEITRPYKIIYTDLPDAHSKLAVQTISQNLDSGNFTTEKDAATVVKRAFDAKYGVSTAGAREKEELGVVSRE